MANTTLITEPSAAHVVVVEHMPEQGAKMPQLDFSTFPNQIFWLLVTLAVIYFVLTRIALPRIGGVLAERQGTIANDLVTAEKIKTQAVEAEKLYEKSLADARTEASNIIVKTKADIQSDLDAEISRADEAISAKATESEAKISEIRAQSSDIAREAAIDTAEALVAALGGSTNRPRVKAEVEKRIKS